MYDTLTQVTQDIRSLINGKMTVGQYLNSLQTKRISEQLVRERKSLLVDTTSIRHLTTGPVTTGPQEISAGCYEAFTAVTNVTPLPVA